MPVNHNLTAITLGRAVAKGGGQRGAVSPAKSTVPPANFDRVISTAAYKRVWSL